MPGLVVLGALELETLRSLELLGLEALELEAMALVALELEALALVALELETLELLTLELEVLELGELGVLSGGLTERREPASRPVSLVRNARRVPRLGPPPILGTQAMALRPSSVPLRVPLLPPFESSFPVDPDPESDLVRAASPTVSPLLATIVTDPTFESTAASALVAELLDFEEDFECLAAAVPRFASMLLAPEGDPGTYVDAVPQSRANIVDGMWIFRVKRPPGSPPAFNVCYVARGFSQRQGVDYFQTFIPTSKMTTLWVLLHVAAQRDYKLHSLDFSTAFLQGRLHEEIWLRRPPGFTGSSPVGT
ncbi:unnamed protein product [Closterium sp. NIES-53]